MTYSKTLAKATTGGKEIIAYESYEKFSAVPHYEIAISPVDNLFADMVVKTARTTWRKRFNQIVQEYTR